MKCLITYDPNSTAPTSVMWLEDRVIRSIVFGVPVDIHVVDIVLVSHRGVLCVTKLRDITLGTPSILLEDDGDKLTMFIPKQPCLFPTEQVIGIPSIQLQSDGEEPPRLF